MLPQRWAVTSTLTSNELSPSELAQVAAACSVQLTRDAPKAWPEINVVAVQSFPDPKAVPLGYDVATVMGLDDMPQGALGFHYTKHRKPAANIGFDPRDRAGVATTTSHELLEASADPSGNRLVVCTVPQVGRRLVLVEIADPPEARTYSVDGLPMSDFVLRDYYGPHRWRIKGDPAPAGSGGAGHPITRAFSFCGGIDAPLVVEQGGYLSFVDEESGEWGQLTWFDGPTPAVRKLGRRDEDDPRSHREWIDSQTAHLAQPHVGRLR